MLTLDRTARKRIATGIAAVLGTALLAFEATPAQAQPPSKAPAWGNRRKQQQNNNHRRATRDDIDGDGIANRRDPDIDGDGIPNGRDSDRDGDGIPNSRDRDNYNSDRWARDNRGNWYLRNVGKSQVGYGKVPAGYSRDRNGKLVRRPGTRRVGDKDGDGIRNRRDRDMDGDGVRNRKDRDKDGDGVRNKNDDADKNPRRR